MKDPVIEKLHELLKLKRFPVPQKSPEDPNEVIVVTSDLPDPKAAGNETFKNKDTLKKAGFKWDQFKKMWITDAQNLQMAQQVVNSINKRDDFVDKLEQLEQVIANSNAITDESQIESRLSSYVQDLANATDEKAADAAIRRYFSFQSKFHRYSFTNTILIMIQKEGATDVAGATDWKTKFNRYVVAGAQPIWIFAPIVYGKGKGSDTPAGEDGALDKEVNSGRIAGFKAVKVYDISDTKPFDENAPSIEEPKWFTEENPTETTEKLYHYITEVIKKLGINFTTDKAHGMEKGYSAGGHINMSSPIKGAGEVSTLVHELAHELMHWKDKSKFYQGDQVKASRQTKELQAESVSYMVMKHYNIPVEHHTTYIALWKGSKKEILDNIAPIQKVAKFIIQNIDEVAEGDQLNEDLYL